MSTNNFTFDNILIVLPEFNYDYKKPCNCCDDENCEFAELDSEFDEQEYREYIKNIQKDLEKIGFDSCDKYSDGSVIAKWGLQDNDGMIKWLEVVVRRGYYTGINIDWRFDGDFGIENEQNKKQVVHYEAMNRKFNRQVVKVEKILRKYGVELKKVGQFSNGEAVYKKVK